MNTTEHTSIDYRRLAARVLPFLLSLAMTVGLVKQAPKDACTVSLTPRRVQRFRPRPGAKLRWTNTSIADGKQVQTGQAVVDTLGLITLKNAAISKGTNREL